MNKREKVDAAVWNNIVWCGIVCETHGIAAASSEHIWRTATKAPMFYPDIITSSRQATREEIVDVIGANEAFSIKDSYANLDMSLCNFTSLFTAEWIYREPAACPESVQTAWYPVATEKELADWTSAHGSGNSIRPELLKRRDVKIYINKKKGEAAGFIASLGADAVGISNVFSSAACDHLWSDIPKIVALDFPGLPLVGYERDADLRAALRSGWEAVGPLRIWVKSSD
ncbi:hypothetical protein [Cohnella thailandensis]|uniref:Uncharacterized protein n=1 Tax=Cohnella thailandensis TaxID=557557 RepID=A0A841SXJ0_9BACL|nr:hypothetical protein [Cohnella thailandensis]MBB6636624.1 hypothetical protein [Cohnella thailandensis]MBP1973501.1 hypothetical protein [Cohnella thailandensis]